jgi:hypothetical protein
MENANLYSLFIPPQKNFCKNEGFFFLN